MNAFRDGMKNTQSTDEYSLEDVIDWIETVYNYVIPENKEPGEHGFNVLDYYEMENIGAALKKKAEYIAALEVALEPFAKAFPEYEQFHDLETVDTFETIKVADLRRVAALKALNGDDVDPIEETQIAIDMGLLPEALDFNEEEQD